MWRHQNQCVKPQRRIPTDGGRPLTQANPFGGLEIAGLAAGGAGMAEVSAGAGGGGSCAKGGRGRLELRREKAGRGGKTVTTIRGEGFRGLQAERLDGYMRRLKNSLGCGGSRRGDCLEFQGDCRAQVERFFAQEGFRVVRAGG